MKTIWITGVLLYVLCGISDAQMSDLSKITNDTLYWGSYRPNLYFGMRNRSPSSFMTGIMWHGVREHRDGREFEQMRHSCEQGDKMSRYGWVRHDGVSFGEQEIADPHNDLLLSTTFVKHNADEHSRGNWTARISGTSLSGNDDTAIALYYYFSFDRTSQDLSAEYFSLPSTPSKGLSDVFLDGYNEELGKFQIHVKPNESLEHPTQPKKDKQLFKSLGDVSKTHFYGNAHYPNTDLWKTKEITTNLLKKEYFRLVPEIMSAQSDNQGKSNKKKDDVTPTWFFPTLPNTLEANSNIVIFQTLVKVPFELDIVFLDLPEESENKKAKKKATGPSEEVTEAVEAISGHSLTTEIENRQKAFDAKFDRTFPLVNFRDPAFAKFAKSTFSNLIGGIGFFHGSGIMKYFEKENPVAGPRNSLYTSVPSRPFFPRGFLWDEGFHQLLIHKWNPVITTEVLRHWFHLMDRNGWIAREQILGEEARSKVPSEFQVQYWNYANPPTFFLVFEKFVNHILHHKNTVHLEEPSEAAQFASTLNNNLLPRTNITYYQNVVEELYPKLQRWHKWFRTTQLGEATGESVHFPFMWQGRTQNHTLTSGLDDYPRAENVSRHELHLDLLCWMAKSVQILKNAAGLLNHSSVKYAEMENQLLAQLEAIHWNDATHSYDDVILRADGSKEFIHHVGYVSLFPLALGLIPKDSEKLLQTIQLIKDPKHLWSDYGIRSLSKQDAYYGQGENYWRGPIWLNMNYLVISSLYNNYIRDGPYASQAMDLYSSLRNNLITNMFQEYSSTGYVWEQYDPNNGQGQRSHPFTGWSALIVSIITEQY